MDEAHIYTANVYFLVSFLFKMLMSELYFC